MPKNKGGGKHKHRKKIVDIKEKFTMILPDNNEIMYVYITKGYGNRTFDGIVLKNKKSIRFRAQMERRKKRVSVGNLIIMSSSDSFSKEFFSVESICSEDERHVVQKSPEYQNNYRAITNEHEIVENDSNICFDYADDSDHETNKIPEQRAIEFPPSDSDEEEPDIDDL